MLSVKFCFSRSTRVPRPPRRDDIRDRQAPTRKNFTFKDDQDEPDISQGQECLLPCMFEDIGQGNTVDDADGDLPDDARVDDLRGEPFRQREEEEE